jgi:hypothetical protein
MSKTISQKPLPVLPTELIGMIMECRGTDTYDALLHELTTTKKQTKKWLRDIVQRITNAYENQTITEKEFKIFIKHRAIFYYLQPSGPKGEGKSLWGEMSK